MAYANLLRLGLATALGPQWISVAYLSPGPSMLLSGRFTSGISREAGKSSDANNQRRYVND
jgi:hypothetical protein